MVLEAFLISLTSSSQGCKPHVFGLSSCIALLITNIVGVRYHDSTIINCSLPLPYGQRTVISASRSIFSFRMSSRFSTLIVRRVLEKLALSLLIFTTVST